MKAKIIRIGNSRGLRIPKPLLAQAGLIDEVEIRVEGTQLIVEAIAAPRAGWREAFADMVAKGEDKLLDPETATEWDLTEWEW